MEGDLAGRRALVTGGASGIGRATAELLMLAGASVVVVDRDRSACDELRDRGAQLLEADLGSAPVASLAERVLALGGPIDLIVHSAARFTEETFLDLGGDELTRTLTVNLTAPWLLTRQLVQPLVAAGRAGAIVFVSSLHARVVRRAPHYSASKAAIETLTKELAFELAPHGIRVNAVAPGWIDTPMGGLEGKTRAYAESVIPLGRPGRPEEVARMIVTLLDDVRSGYVTGTTVTVDGGLSLFSWIS